jgi:hypothetical protein
MRKYINALTEGQTPASVEIEEDAPKSSDKFMRVKRVMDAIQSEDPSTEDGVARLMEKINYLCDAMLEWAERRTRKGDHATALMVKKAVADARAMFPRDGDVERTMANPNIKRNCRDAVIGLRSAMSNAGIVVEGEERLDELFGFSKKDKAEKYINGLKLRLKEILDINEYLKRVKAIDEFCVDVLSSGKEHFRLLNTSAEYWLFKALKCKSKVSMEFITGTFYVENFYQNGDRFLVYRTIWAAEYIAGPITYDNDKTYNAEHEERRKAGKPVPNRFEKAWKVYTSGQSRGYTWVWFTSK